MAVDFFEREFCHTPSVVFEGRNKAYGAFELRQIYERNVLVAVLVAIVFSSLALATPVILKYFASKMEKEEEITVPVDMSALEEPPQVKETPPPPKIEPPPPPKVSSIKFIPPEVVKDEEVTEEPPPTIEELEDKAISNETVEGDPNAEEEIVIEENFGDGKEIGQDDDQVFMIVEQQAEYPGGVQAMYKFLQSNIKYPAQAREMEIEGKVFVSFTVERDGSISDVKVLRGVGGGCDEEAVRVVKSMPKWMPGKQGGRAVRSNFKMPIHFKLN